MIKKQRIAQSAFVSIGLLLFFLTYLYYPNLYKDKSFTDKFLKKDYKKTTQEDQITTFENMEYKGLYDFDKPFTVKSEKAYMLNEEPSIIYMVNMRVI